TWGWLCNTERVCSRIVLPATLISCFGMSRPTREPTPPARRTATFGGVLGLDGMGDSVSSGAVAQETPGASCNGRFARYPPAMTSCNELDSVEPVPAGTNLIHIGPEKTGSTSIQ